MSADSDRLLVQQIRQADASAWGRLIDRYEGRLLAFVKRRLRNDAVAEDLVQETFIGFLNSLPNFDDRRELQTWLFTIAAHKITDHLRRQGRRPILNGDDDLASRVDGDQPAASSLARGHERQQIEQQTLARGLEAIVRSWQQKGDFTRIKVLELLLVRGMANRDVARILGISEQQVANYRFAALRKLTDHVRAAGLPAELFPELAVSGEEA
jgi:RNA polymerase sigma-70 factor (ECF subfamily)